MSTYKLCLWRRKQTNLLIISKYSLNIRLLVLPGLLVLNTDMFTTTVKFLNFWTQENFAVNNLKFKQRPNLKVFCQKICKWYSKK